MQLSSINSSFSPINSLNSVTLSNRITGPKPSLIATTTPQLTIKDVEKMVASIDASQIGLIATEIGDLILNNLGPIGKSAVAQQVRQIKDPSGHKPTDMIYRTIIMAANDDIEAGRKFLTEEQGNMFIEYLTSTIKKIITNAFSTSFSFIGSGIAICLSDFHPEQILMEGAKEAGVQITFADVPTKFYVRLKLDKELTSEKELVFNLISESEGVEFASNSFTINQLEQQFRDLLASFPKF